jgi:cytochrome c-type biogenesis protein CcmH/NrfG
MGKLFLFFGLAGMALAASGDLDRARVLYERTDYPQALQLLSQMEPKDASVWALMGRSHYMAGELKEATECFEKAVALDGNSEYYHWLGRAWGRRAETSSWFTAMQWARKTRGAFEKAVALDPRNIEAINDLLEFYLQAPGFLGGGIDKADALTGKIKAVDEVEYYWASAKIAEKRKEFGKAEEQLRMASEMAPKQVGRVLDLAKFFAKQGKFIESDAAFQRARRLAPNSPKVMFEQARTLIETKRNYAEARRLLEKYLQAELTPEDPSREEALRLLRQVRGG